MKPLLVFPLFSTLASVFFFTLVGTSVAGGADKPTISPTTTPSYLITDDDLPGKLPSSGTLFTIGAGGALSNPTRVSLGGAGVGGGYFNANRVSVLNVPTSPCAFLALGGASEISVVDLNTQQDIGNFPAASTDLGTMNGIGLANNGTYLYANFTGSGTLATFAIGSGCTLQFLSDISPLGLNGGNLKGMALHGNMLIATFGDGSIESFNISAGVPVSNNDLQTATGYSTDRFPTGIDITADGHYAIFGDQSTTTTVEVSDISSGKLATTVLYNFASAGNSTNVRLSPDETLLYITNTSTGQVTAAFFNASNGRITPGCVSNRLKGFDNQWVFLSSPVTELNTGTGSVLYLAEYGGVSGIALINVTSSGGKCTLTEAASSPAVDPNTETLLSIEVYPPRPF
jgi:6-phosphogluconolactonase (cycloisomerase 2 family)